MTVSALILWAYALVALSFGALALAQLRHAGSGLPRLAFTIALAMTALWGLTIAGIGTEDVARWIAESARSLAWLCFMMVLVRRDRAAAAITPVAIVYGIEVVLILASGLLAVSAASIADPAAVASINRVAIVLRMIIAVTALVLVQHLYRATALTGRGGIRLVVAALATMWLFDLLLYTIRYLQLDALPEWILLRGAAMLLIAPLFGIAAHRGGDWTLNVSRTLAFQSLSLVATGVYIVLVVLATSGIAAIAGPNARMWQTAFVLGSTAGTFTFFSTPWLRGWLKVKLAKHFFSHRYDYRAEWLRFTDTLGKPGDGAPPLEERIVKAVADLTDSPGGLLLVPDGAALDVGADWRWGCGDQPVQGANAALARYLESTGRIVELDPLRSDGGDPEERSCVPLWMLDRADAWVLVPLVHFGKLAGALLLARPPVDRSPDWEDLDMLRVAGRQAASYLAEARAHQALSDAQRFDEFNRRFAFIMHDIKNIVSQLSLVARNAERHAGNPDFRIDMIETLKGSAARMNDLLARLSQHHSGRVDPLGPVEIMAVAEKVAARRRAQHRVVTAGDRAAVAVADAARLEQLLGHLVQNAIEASPADEPVTMMIARAGPAVAIDVIDHGAGMSPAFIRDRLFKPFVSSKPGGFGLGAFEARQLAEAMGGTVTVHSREGEGTRFRVSLTAAAAMLGEAA